MATTSSLTVNASKVASTLTDYPAYVDLSEMPAAFWAEVANGGGDIRVYSDSGLTTELAREVVSCNTATDTGEMHVKVPSLTTSTVIYVTTDGVSSEPAAASTYGSENVWTEYALVMHNGASIDATGNGNYTSTSNLTPGDSTGPLGAATDYAAADAISTLYNPDEDAMTISLWLNGNSNLNTAATDNNQFVYHRSANRNFSWNWAYDTDDINGRWYDTSNAILADTTWSGPNSVLGTSGWHYGVNSRDDTAEIAYQYWDGVERAETTTFSGTGSHGVPSVPMSISYLGDNNDEWNGLVAEFRVAHTQLDPDWIITEYNNQSDVATFWTVADEGGGGVTKNALFFGGGM